MPRPSARRIAQAVEAAEARASQHAPRPCPLCDRPIPPGARSSLHHLVPRLKGGTNLGTVRLHQICHSAIHARFSEADLARRLHDIAALRADPEIAAFIAWVQDKPPEFHAPTHMTRERRDLRRERSR
jgi:hypothetical protein